MLEFEILGGPGRDNALFVRVDSGQALARLLFDCGQGCLIRLPRSESLDLDHIFFSHFHMDHIGGFDSLFRGNYNRHEPPMRVWGPAETIRILHHRFRSYLWNLHEDQRGTWIAHQIGADATEAARFELHEAFEILHPEPAPAKEGATILETGEYSVEAYAMDHKTPSLAYVVREKARLNIDPAKLQAIGLPPGPWLAKVKDPAVQGEFEAAGQTWDFAKVRADLLTETPGESIAYLTDFLMDDAARDRLREPLRGVNFVVCEAQYRHEDLELAQRHYHMTARQAAEFAAEAGVGQLILFHLSDRYRPGEWLDMLKEARAAFPNTRFPEGWRERMTGRRR
ncbi:MAG: MBL fold metallo-hydrolase [Verrucomicrobiales bacterium]